jgi:hypothetical protein
MAKRDIVVASAIGKWMDELNASIFPDKPARILLNMTALLRDPSVTAGYADAARNNGEEAYLVVVPGIAKRLYRARKTYGPPLTLRQLALAAAAHEVRHRMQFNLPLLRRFQKDAEYSDPVLGAIAPEVKRRRAAMCASGAPARRQQESEFDELEFDTYMIEHLIVRLMLSERNPNKEDIRQILLMEPAAQ